MITAATSFVRTRHNFSRHCSSIPNFVDIVANGIGSLQDMESKLDDLQVPINQSIATQVIDSCATVNNNCSRRLLRFMSWCKKNSNDELGYEVFNRAIQLYSKMKDIRAIDIALLDLQKEGHRIKPKTFDKVIEAFVNLGRPEKVVSLFRDIEEKHKISLERCENEDWSSITSAVHALCTKGHARKALGILWHHKDKVENYKINRHKGLILHGWSVHGNAKEARGVIDEIKKSGNCPSLASYHDLLRCICNRNLKFNPSALVPEAINIMAEMRSSGIYPTTTSFKILLSCLGKTRRVKESLTIFDSMLNREEGEEAFPDSACFLIVIRLLYLTGRFNNGNKILSQMFEEEDKGRVNLNASLKFYQDLIGVLCGLKEVERALKVFEMMKNRCRPSIKDYGPIYDLLINYLCRNGKYDLGRRFWIEAVDHGITLKCSSDLLDPLKAPPQYIFSTVKSLVKASRKDIQVKKKYTYVGRNNKSRGKKVH